MSRFLTAAALVLGGAFAANAQEAPADSASTTDALAFFLANSAGFEKEIFDGPYIVKDTPLLFYLNRDAAEHDELAKYGIVMSGLDLDSNMVFTANEIVKITVWAREEKDTSAVNSLDVFLQEDASCYGIKQRHTMDALGQRVSEPEQEFVVPATQPISGTQRIIRVIDQLAPKAAPR